MKKIVIAVSVVAVLAFALSAMAFGLGDVKQKTGGLSNVAIQEGINKDIEKKTKDCTFKPTKVDLTCDINKIIGSLTAARTTLETSGIADDVDVHFKTNGPNSDLARQRYDNLTNKVKAKVSYWDYYGDYNEVKSDPNGFKMWVEVR